jgi:hypothetical protein
MVAAVKTILRRWTFLASSSLDYAFDFNDVRNSLMLSPRDWATLAITTSSTCFEFFLDFIDNVG